MQAALRGELDSPITASIELQSLAAARTIERKLAKFLDDIAHSLQKNAESSQLIMETLTSMNLPRSPENERRVGAALGEALERVVESTRDSSFIEVDIGASASREVLPLRVSYEPSLAVSRFLDYIWFEIRDHAYIPAYTYGVTWVLQDATTGQSLFEIGRTWAEKSLGENFDSRPLADIGIKPGMRFEATRVR